MFIRQCIKNNYNITKFIPGHSKNKGIDANIMKNPIWITDDNKYLMYCEKDTICTLCEKSYKILKDFEKNKRILGSEMPSKRMRNKMAGYLAKVSRQKQAEAKKLKLE